MIDLVIDCILDALKDGALSIPILFIAYLLMELLERSRKLDENILHTYSKKAGPLLGGVLGIIPQCGISGAAATMFSTGAVSVGTMLAVFFATSDEMLPVMLSTLADGESIDAGSVAAIVGAKALIGIVLGYAADALFGRYFTGNKDIHSFCERENCDCEDEGSVWAAALRHTLRIAVMLIGVNILLNMVLNLVGIEKMTSTVLADPVIGELLLAALGLIPNCSVSVVITQGYLSGIIGIGGLFAGLLSNAGIGLLVLFRTNRSMKENLAIVVILYAFGALAGMLVGAAV